MNIDLSLLHSKTQNEIDITNTYEIPQEYYEKSNIIKLDSVEVSGKIIEKENDELDDTNDYCECTIKGVMVIEDSISLEPIEYEYSIEYNDFIEENCKINENILDIFQFLWENIVLEVPLRLSEVKDLSKFHGDGWKLISEEEHNSSNNPFSELLKDYKEE